MNNLTLQTKVIEEVPTSSGHIYRQGFMTKVMEKLKPLIPDRKCYVTIGHNVHSMDVLMARGDIAGIVTSFNVFEGQGIVKIEPQDTLHGQLLCSYVNSGLDLKIDFRVQGVLEDTPDENGNYYVCMDDFGVEPGLAVVQGD